MRHATDRLPQRGRRRWLSAGPGLALAVLAPLHPCAAQPADAPGASRWREALQRAWAQREAAVRAGDQPYGAAVADAQGRVVAEAPSRVVTLNDPNAHAERQALAAAQARMGRQDLGGLVLVGSSRPCGLCQRAAARAGIAHIAWGDGGDGQQSVTPLVEAAGRGELAELRALLEDRAAIDARDLRGRTALLAAVQAGHDAVALELIGRGADINAQDEIADSPFLLAGARGRTAMLRAMLTPPAGSAARPDYRRLNRYGGTALIPACHYGHVATVRLLLEASRIDVNHANRLGWTAQLEAVILGDGGAAHAEIVGLLLAHRADPNKADAQGVSPLAHARQRGQARVAALIAASGGH